MKLMPKTACDISYAYDAKGRLASAVPVYHCYLQDHRGNPRLSMIHGVNIRQFSRITGVCFGVIHRAKSGSESPDPYGLIDNLSYTYNGNQLVTVTDGRSGPDYSGAFHFSDGADEDVEYEYDQNGNLTKDLNKKITQIKYNLLNLPSHIHLMEGYANYYINHDYGARHFDAALITGGQTPCDIQNIISTTFTLLTAGSCILAILLVCM